MHSLGTILRSAAAGVSILACAGGKAEPEPGRAPASAHTVTSFVNRVWRVSESATIAPGQLYVFLSEGTLVVASPTGTPSLGRWRDDGGTLTMWEEGVPYRVDLRATGTELRLRVHNPGTPVEMTLVPAG